jgi:hypothetical protein
MGNPAAGLPRFHNSYRFLVGDCKVKEKLQKRNPQYVADSALKIIVP